MANYVVCSNFTCGFQRSAVHRTLNSPGSWWLEQLTVLLQNAPAPGTPWAAGPRVAGNSKETFACRLLLTSIISFCCTCLPLKNSSSQAAAGFPPHSADTVQALRSCTWWLSSVCVFLDVLLQKWWLAMFVTFPD